MKNYLSPGKFQLIHSEKVLGLYYAIDSIHIIIYILYKNKNFIKPTYEGIFENSIFINQQNIFVTTLLYENKNFNSQDSVINNIIIDIILEENKDFINQFLNQEINGKIK